MIHLCRRRRREAAGRRPVQTRPAGGGGDEKVVYFLSCVSGQVSGLSRSPASACWSLRVWEAGPVVGAVVGTARKAAPCQYGLTQHRQCAE